MKSLFKQTTVKVKDLVPNPKNPRMDLRPGMPMYDKLRKSIENFGYIDPIIWNRRTGMIVSGHQRFQVMKDIAEEKGEPFDTVDVMEVDMPENKQDSFMVAVNKITGIWDNEKLAQLFRELSEEDLQYTGYESFEIDELLSEKIDLTEYEDDDTLIDNTEEQSTYKLMVFFDSEDERDSFYEELKDKGMRVKK